MNRLDTFGTAGTLDVEGVRYRIHRIADLTPEGLPYSLRVLLENLLRHEDGRLVTAAQIEAVTRWGSPDSHATALDLHPSRVFMHDTNGVPALADLAAMRETAMRLGEDPGRVNPRIPAELVVDHSVIVDVFGRPDAARRNVEIEYIRNAERYRFLRWGQQNLDRFAVVPPGTGIMHQVNVEHLARVVETREGWAFPDVCLGTDSHTTMVNGLGVLGWGIGGIEAEAAMLGQSLSMLLPRVVGVHLRGVLPEGTTATDLVLTITELLRGHGVVGKFVEFSGPGVARLTLADRVTIANMSPEFGSTCAFFAVDDETLRYLRLTGRDSHHVSLVEAYTKEQGLWHDPTCPPTYSEEIHLDLSTVRPSLAGPRRPQDRVTLDGVRPSFAKAVAETGGSHGPVAVSIGGAPHELRDGAVAIAAITSCTNTSNPSVMVAAGLLARNAVRRGLHTPPWVKTSLSPGSRTVTDYLRAAGLTAALDALGFHHTGYGCMTCIGASGPLIDEVAAAVAEHDLTVAAVLSSNRNFDGRINPDVRQNWLAAPPLVVAYALAGTVDIDLAKDPLGTGSDGEPVYLRDVWPTGPEVQRVVETTVRADMFRRAYEDVFAGDARWQNLDVPAGKTFAWDDDSSYLRRPPYFDDMARDPSPLRDIEGARVLVRLGDSITTDHICPAGAIPPTTPAGRHLTTLGVDRFAFNTYASRRGNHEVMMRGTFANVRLRNQLVPGVEGGYTLDPAGDVVSVFDAAAAYREAGLPMIVLAGRDYGAGSSRDWAAKGPALLGVRAVIAESFERIHRSNLIGMGVLPLQFLDGDTADVLGLTGHERFDIQGLAAANPGPVPNHVTVQAGRIRFIVRVRLDTHREQDYYRHGGILRYVLRSLLDELARPPSSGES